MERGRRSILQGRGSRDLDGGAAEGLSPRLASVLFCPVAGRRVGGQEGRICEGARYVLAEWQATQPSHRSRSYSLRGEGNRRLPAAACVSEWTGADRVRNQRAR